MSDTAWGNCVGPYKSTHPPKLLNNFLLLPDNSIQSTWQYPYLISHNLRYMYFNLQFTQRVSPFLNLLFLSPSQNLTCMCDYKFPLDFLVESTQDDIFHQKAHNSVQLEGRYIHVQIQSSALEPKSQLPLVKSTFS